VELLATLSHSANFSVGCYWKMRLAVTDPYCELCSSKRAPKSRTRPQIEMFKLRFYTGSVCVRD